MTQPSDFRGPPGPPPDIRHLTVSCVDTKNQYCRLVNDKRGIDFGADRLKMYENATQDNFFLQTQATSAVRFNFGSPGYRRSVAQWTPNLGFRVFRKDGRETQFDDANGQNKIYGKTKIDGSVIVRAGIVNLANGWSIDTRDGHFRLKYNGDQKFVMHQDGKGWQGNGGWLCSRAFTTIAGNTPLNC